MFKLAFFMCVCALVQAQLYVNNDENSIEYYGNENKGLLSTIKNGINNIGKSISGTFTGKGEDGKNKGLGNGPTFGNGGVLDRATNRAAQILVPLLKGVDKSITSFEAQLESFKNSIWINIDKLRGGADIVQDKFQEFVDKLDENLKTIVANFANGETNVTSCGDIVLKFRNQAMEMALNSSNCAKNLIDGVVGAARNVSNAGDRILEGLTLARKSLVKCGESMEGGLSKFMSGLRCITEANLKSARIIAKEIPSFVVESAKTATSVVTASPKVQSCITSSVLGAVFSQYQIVLKQVGQCLTNLGKAFNPADFPAPKAPKFDAIKDNKKNIEPAKDNEKKSDLKKEAPVTEEQKKKSDLKKEAPVTEEQKKKSDLKKEVPVTEEQKKK